MSTFMLNPIVYWRMSLQTGRLLHPSNGFTAKIGPWPPPLRFHNHAELDTR
jgi:hypothetical protein